MQLESERREKSMDRNRSCETEELREYKAEILGHPLYDQLLSAHVSCLRIATPVDQLPRIDAQLQQSQRVLQKYSDVGIGNLDPKELHQFMTHYVLLLCAFKEQLQQHVRVHAMEAMMTKFSQLGEHGSNFIWEGSYPTTITNSRQPPFV